MSSIILSDSDLSSDTDEEVIEMNVIDFGKIINKKPKQFLFNKVEFNSYKMKKDLKIDNKPLQIDNKELDSVTYLIHEDSTIYNIK